MIISNANVVFDLTNLHRSDNFTNFSGRTLDGELQLTHPNLKLPQLLPTLMVPNRASSDGILRVLLDTGSTSSFITAKALKGVRHETLDKKVTLSVDTLHGTKVQHSRKVRCYLEASLGFVSFDCFVVPFIMSINYENTCVDDALHKRLNALELNESIPRKGGDVDILLGVVDMWTIVQGIDRKIGESLVIMKTKFGLVPCGILREQQEDVDNFVTAVEQLNKNIERMLTIEELPRDHTDQKLSVDEIMAVESMSKNLRYNPVSGRFTTRLLWRSGQPMLINNIASAKARLEGLMRRLKKDPGLKATYLKAMNEYIDQCTVEEVTNEMIEEMGNLGRTDIYFLPHRAVYDPTCVSMKCRIVCDASAKSPSGFSLNNSLLPGPPLQQAIVAVELRFRTNRIALIGDISKMFLQIKVDPIDRQYLRFLWWDPDDPKATTKVYQFRTLIFGAADSPFQAISCLQRLVKDRLLEASLTTFERRACDTILRDTYVDDVTTGGDSVEEAFTMYEELCNLLDRGHFKIHKWATNSPELLKKIPKEARAPTTTDEEESSLFLSEETSSLGIRWDPLQDTFIFRRYCSIAIHNDDTKTSVASLLARPFDPLGLISPFILLARKILKGTFEEKINWKEKLPQNLQQEWHRWLEMLPELNDVTFPRYVEFNDTTELHVFGDTSANMGHGVAAYARTLNKESNRYESTLLFAKSKINPTKDISVPRLELVAALLCAKIADMISEELDFPKNRIFCYSDSETTLWWLTKKPNSLLPFVANRVQKIQEFGYVFQYVNTQINPADIASRGCAPNALKRTLWTQGPNFLRLPREEWKIPKVDFSKVDKLQEVKKQFVYSHLTISKTYEEYPQNIHKVAAYARTLNKESNRYESTLLFAKSKINPTKDISVPRLELVAALLCAKIADMTSEELDFPKNRIFCYSDSETTLWWLTKKPNSLLPFVANRVQKIQEFGYVFQYVNTQINPADIASRGCAPNALKRTLWTQGPNFLRLPREEWKIPKVDFSKVDKLQEVKKQFVYSHLTISKTYEEYPQKMMVVNMADYYGDHDLLLRKTMLIIEIVDVWKTKALKKKSAILYPNKISHHKQRARLYWIKQAQYSHFAEEIENLRRGQDIPRNSKLSPLNPQLDENGVLRVHGRLVEAPLLEIERFPIILPKGHGFVSSLILKIHLDNQHSPVDWTHFYLRQQYWIISSRASVGNTTLLSTT